MSKSFSQLMTGESNIPARSLVSREFSKSESGMMERRRLALLADSETRKMADSFNERNKLAINTERQKQINSILQVQGQ